jgi:hypothetical protein
MNLLQAYRDRRREQQTQEAYAREIADINAAYARLFSTEDGKYVLDHMVKMNLAVPVATKGDDLLDIGVKQGRANLVNEVIQRIEADKIG